MPRFKSLTWVPNLFTLSNLSLGFFSILLAFQSRTYPGALTLAGFLILLAAVCDGLDGFAARLLDAQSELGAQLDSMADLTTFGIAPGVLMYNLVLHRFHFHAFDALIPAGIFIAVLYPICAAFRLARFNIQHDVRSFRGLPSPVAGVIVALMPLAFRGAVSPPMLPLTTVFILAAFLMVSTVKYLKLNVDGLRKFSPIRIALLVSFIIASLVIAYLRLGPQTMAAGLFFVLVLYIVIGLVSLILQLIQFYRV